MCSQLYSDNATNFVRAARELYEVYKFLAKSENEIGEELVNRKIERRFIFPGSLYFGVLWKAVVKAIKRHLNTRRFILTYEEYNTLNNRNCGDVKFETSNSFILWFHDLVALIPTHFLIEGSLLEPVQNNFVDVSDNKLSRWQHLQKIRQYFWKRWHREYLQTLQTRSKWFTNPNINID